MNFQIVPSFLCDQSDYYMHAHHCCPIIKKTPVCNHYTVFNMAVGRSVSADDGLWQSTEVFVYVNCE